MKNNTFIIFYNYDGFKNYENILMSLIVGLHNSKMTICFSNGYAALKCGVSISTITRTINNFIENGYINCFYNKDNSRIIYLIKEPILVEDSIDCGVEIDSSTSNHPDHTSNHPDYTLSSQEVEGIVTVTNNNIVDNIDNKIIHKIDDNIGVNRTSGKIFIDEQHEELFNKFLNDGFSEEDAMKLSKDGLSLIIV